MADIIENQTQPEVKIPEGITPEVHQQMQFALTGKMPEETSLGNEPEVATIETTALTAPPVETIPFSFDIFKEFNYEKPEQVVEDIKAYQNYKNNPPQPQEIKFEGDYAEDSKKIYQALQAGKFEDVYSFLHEQTKLNQLTSQDVTEENAADIIKLNMALKYKDLTPREIDYKFNKQYSLPKEPVIKEGELSEDFEIRHNEWKERVSDIKNELTIDAKLARPELAAHKKNFVLPPIEQSTVNQDYVNFQSEWELLDKEFAATQNAVKTFTPNLFEFKMPFTDEANKIAFEFQYVPDQESFSKTAQSVMEDPIRATAYRNQDGTIDSKASFRDQYILQNFDKIMLAAMNQAKNAAIKSMLPSNSSTGMQRQTIDTPGEKTELQQNMELALGPYLKRTPQHN